MFADGQITDNLNDLWTEQSYLSSLSREYATPLALISGLSLELQRPDVTKEQVIKSAQRIQLSSDRLINLVETVLRGYSVNQNELELHFEPIVPQRIMEEVAHELEPHAHKQGQIIAVSQQRRHYTISADRQCLRSVIFNLLDNAIKCSEAEATIELSARQRHESAQFVIKDFGRGIKRADLKQLFSQFGRVKRPVPQWATSTGLGLYVAKQLTEAMNGRLDLSRHKAGSSFLVTLPLSEQLSLFR